MQNPVKTSFTGFFIFVTLLKKIEVHAKFSWGSAWNSQFINLLLFRHLDSKLMFNTVRL
jgi:hypothetical protein